MINLNDKIPNYLQNIFVVDVQCDVDKSVEYYDLKPQTVYFLTAQGPTKQKINDKLSLPMLPDISEKDILDILELSCQDASDIFQPEIMSGKMLCNPNLDVKKLWETYEKWKTYPPRMFREGGLIDIIKLSFVPIDCVFFLPEPEYLGCISVNANNFGCFCLSKNVSKKPLE